MAVQRVTVFGGTGFLGRRVVTALLQQGCAVRVASRHPERGAALAPDGNAALESVQADINDDGSVAAAVAGSYGVVNAVSLYVERHGQTFHSVHVEAAARLARQARDAGVERLAHVSGIGSDPQSASPYIRSRGKGEQVVRQAFANAVMIRPAVMFGPDDSLVVPLITLLRRLPVFALFGSGKTRLQPAYVEDVAQGIAESLQIAAPAEVYEFGGPQVYSYQELVRLLARQAEARTLIVPMPFALWQSMAYLAEQLPSPPITRNQVELMRVDNVAAGDRPGFADLGIAPRRLEELLPALLPQR